jgi:hypothetical protein
MSRPRKPTAMLETTGAFVIHPERQRERAAEPKPTAGLGDPPANYGREQKAIWHEIAATLPYGVAGNSDRTAFGKLVRLEAEDRHGRLTGAEQGLLVSLFGKFGMTPSDRSKVRISNDSAQDPLEEFS